MDTAQLSHYRSHGGVNYSVLWNADDRPPGGGGVDLNPDVYAYGAIADRVPGFVNGSEALINGSEVLYGGAPLDGNGTNTSCVENATACANASASGVFVPLDTWQIALFGFLAAGTILMTIIGNLIVLLSFILERNIRQPTNYFIASLAMSDLLIGVMSMPFYTVYLLSNQTWTLGSVMCDMWLSVDYSACLISIYTVFAITVDRFCSVKIPAKYRSWRTRERVLIIIALTWIIPVLLFFTSIFGWQYFTGKRTVPENMCYVQYLEEAIFSCILQVCYFWITLLVMVVLYTGIYKVALDLQRRAEVKRKKMTSLVSIAGQTMTRIGIGMSQQTAVDAQKLFAQTANNAAGADGGDDVMANSKRGGSGDRDPTNGASSTSFSLRNPDKDEDRSSSPAFPSDTDHSSQSPKRSPMPRPEVIKHHHHHKRSKRGGHKEPKPFKLQNPPKGRRNRKASHGVNGRPTADADVAQNTVAPPRKANCAEPRDGNPRLSEGMPPPDYGTLSPNTQSPTEYKALLNEQDDVPPSCKTTATIIATTTTTGAAAGTTTTTTGAVFCSSPELLAGVQYIDQDSLQSLQSSDNLRNLADAAKALSLCRQETGNDGQQTPDSPIWKMRGSLVGRDRSPDDQMSTLSPKVCKSCPSNSPAGGESELNSPALTTPSPRQSPTASLAVEPRAANNSHHRLVTSQLSRSSDCQTPRTGDEGTPAKGGRRGRPDERASGGSPLSNIVKTVKRSKRAMKPKAKQQTKQSRSENRARKALRTITIILGAFVLCWTPWHILSLVIGFTDNHGVVLLKLYDISYWLCYLNSPINPLCYAFANAQFKKAFIRILKMDWRRR
ncbi:hypothetical protein LSH36_151g04021 [Paralvinella palmiformis]|uniref:G-protein coupled receptors family 1 profile domain-containing protein n=1 Tax=Paralvinella palmiformis TaxID=53620 RepID=A0AAD9JVE8_9ANNE|nr:hypothetical protein LSH36_151g04021 [Paralvinella palmiformis]